jgi:STE24 endopeptidase
MMFVFLLNVFNTVTNFPFSIYSTFVLEEKHGFNKQVSALKKNYSR